MKYVLILMSCLSLNSNLAIASSDKKNAIFALQSYIHLNGLNVQKCFVNSSTNRGSFKTECHPNVLLSQMMDGNNFEVSEKLNRINISFYYFEIKKKLILSKDFSRLFEVINEPGPTIKFYVEAEYSNAKYPSHFEQWQNNMIVGKTSVNSVELSGGLLFNIAENSNVIDVNQKLFGTEATPEKKKAIQALKSHIQKTGLNRRNCLLVIRNPKRSEEIRCFTHGLLRTLSESKSVSYSTNNQEIILEWDWKGKMTVKLKKDLSQIISMAQDDYNITRFQTNTEYSAAKHPRGLDTYAGTKKLFYTRVLGVYLSGPPLFENEPEEPVTKKVVPTESKSTKPSMSNIVAASKIVLSICKFDITKVEESSYDPFELYQALMCLGGIEEKQDDETLANIIKNMQDTAVKSLGLEPILDKQLDEAISFVAYSDDNPNPQQPDRSYFNPPPSLPPVDDGNFLSRAQVQGFWYETANRIKICRYGSLDILSYKLSSGKPIPFPPPVFNGTIEECLAQSWQGPTISFDRKTTLKTEDVINTVAYIAKKCPTKSRNSFRTKDSYFDYVDGVNNKVQGCIQRYSPPSKRAQPNLAKEAPKWPSRYAQTNAVQCLALDYAENGKGIVRNKCSYAIRISLCQKTAKGTYPCKGRTGSLQAGALTLKANDERLYFETRAEDWKNGAVIAACKAPDFPADWRIKDGVNKFKCFKRNEI